MENPDLAWKQGWKPNNRPQSTVAKNFMTELDSLFRLDGDLDSLDKNILEKKQAVSTQTQELEALEARLRAAEDRLKQATTSSPSRRPDAPRRSPLQPAFPPADGSSAQMPPAGAPPSTPTASPHHTADYVLVERPRSPRPVGAEKA
ncbi:hypothetical protein BDU57DRAFT_449018 [Ampelomyces quisqualis]|uniref:Uncharacterized protein n=1 Tax=Ampelomyces quisqualis TaxID=50730 RepID=A0A6A5QN05_AMPQU|nr:hypothetical protein BDU57DRAFT_449018 [Ampelomyces quisqualis]